MAGVFVATGGGPVTLGGGLETVPLPSSADLRGENCERRVSHALVGRAGSECGKGGHSAPVSVEKVATLL